MSKGRKGIRRLTTAMRGKLSIVFIGIFCLFLVLVIRLIYWNVKDGTRFRNIVLGQQNHTSTSIAYERGKIYDRNGNILAANEKVYTLILEPKNIIVKLSDEEKKDPKKVEESKKVMDATVEALSKYLGYNQIRLKRKIEDNPDSYYEIYREDDKELNFDQVEAFKAFREKGKLSYDSNTTPQNEIDEIEKARLISGVMFEESYRRIYPYKSLACRVLGFTSSGNQGNWGIEQQYNSVLNGVNGRSYYYFDEELTQRQTVKDAVDGNSVVSTLDMRIQKIIEKRLRQYDDSIGSKETNILVMDPNTGEVLAMAGSNPYDLNDPMNEEYLKIHYTEAQINEMKAYTKKVEEEAAAKARRERGEEEPTTEEEEDTSQKADKNAVPDLLPGRNDKTKEADKQATENTEEKKTEKKGKPLEKTIYEGFYELWRNSIISDTKEPGSTFKPFTVAAGFETGTLSGKEDYYCDGALSVGKRRIGCSHVHGDITLKQAVAESCNVAMMNIAYKEGADKFYYYQNLFGFGRKTGIDLPGEADTSTLVYNADNYQNDVTLCTNSFGQNFNCSMIQLAAGFASLINGGHYYKPWVVKQIQSDDGAVVEDINKVLVRDTVSEETSRTLRNYMRSTVTSGTGRIAQIPGYTVAGKTGTAEKIPRNKEDYYISFMAFVPADNPQIMVYVTIDEPHVKNQATAGPAVNLARQCLEDILPVLEMEPTEKITQSDLDRYKLYTGYTWDPENRVAKKKKKHKKK